MRDEAVLPILHLNGFKIANPTVLAMHQPRGVRRNYFQGYGYDPHFVEGSDPAVMHQALAGVLDQIFLQICRDSESSASNGKDKVLERPRWPMIILRTPKG